MNPKRGIRMSPKVIHCIEVDWDNEDAKKCSVKGVLDFLSDCEEIVRYEHVFCESMDDLKFAIDCYGRRNQTTKPQILYIACHGTAGAINVKGESLDIEEMGDILNGAFSEKRRGIVVFGSCSTAKTYPSRLKKFLEKTGAFAIVGYTNVVDFSYSTAFEMLLLRELQKNVFNMVGYGAIKRKVSLLKEMFHCDSDESRSVNVSVQFINDENLPNQ